MRVLDGHQNMQVIRNVNLHKGLEISRCQLGSFELRVLRVDELLAEKVRAVMTRDKPRDVYDVWFLLSNGVELDRGLVEKKLKAYSSHFSMEGFMAAAKRKRGMWVSDLRDLIIGALPEFGAVLQNITRTLGKGP
jgi:predicted nucleotidyltransferase component of viral defense system